MPSKRKGSSNSSGNDGDPSPSPPVAEANDQTQKRPPAPPAHHQPLVPGTVLRSERATKIKVEANLGRDLGIFALLLVGLVVVSLSLGGVGNVDEETLKKRLEKAKDGTSKARMWPGQRIKAGYSEWSTWMGQIIKDLDYMPEEEERCKLYVADSSIPVGVGVGVDDENLKLLEGFGAGPGYGYGLYAGKTIREGEVVVDAGAQLTAGVDGESYQMPQHAMIIKPHPTASNVQFVVNEQHYIALRNIRPGEELFVDMPSSESVYFSLFEHLPTRESYRLAQEILTNELDDLTKKNSPEASSKDKIMPARSQRSRGPNKKPKRRDNTEKVDEKSLRLIRKIVARFDHLASLLLPETSAKLEVAKTFGIDAAVLNNRTMPQVYRQGQCFDGAKPIASVYIDEERKGALLKRNVTKGEIIMSIPLLAVEKAGTSAKHACFKIDDHDDDESSSFLCSLSEVGAIARYTELNASLVSERGDNCEGCPNAAYNWSSWNPSHDLVRELGVAKASEDFPFALSLDVVAAQDMEEGTEIILQSNSLPKASVIPPKGLEEGISSEL